MCERLSLKPSSVLASRMVTHFRDEELLLPFFIIHHAPMFDRVIAIDYNSTDRSVQLFEEYAPPSWQIVPSETGGVFKTSSAVEISFERACNGPKYLPVKHSNSHAHRACWGSKALKTTPRDCSVDSHNSKNHEDLYVTWKLPGEVFDARKCDAQVMFWEKQVPEDWVVALTTTEFLVYPAMRLDLHEKQDQFPFPCIMHIPNLAMTHGCCGQRVFTSN